MSWCGDFTDEMLALKRAGYTFDGAWAQALEHHPPRLREIGGGRTSLGAQPTLEEDRRSTADNRESLGWFKGVCRAAWENAPARSGGPSRLYLLPGLVEAMQDRDESRSAQRRKLSRAA